QAAGKLPYATTLWLLDAVARHATAASSDFLRSRSGGAPTGASTGSADNATKTDGRASPPHPRGSAAAGARRCSARRASTPFA
ncbi:hypothetical protein Ctob_005182, partial [Chrysochromulina tobinii]